MKSNAQRQKELRQQRTDSAHRRLNVWISSEAYDALSEAARRGNTTRMALLNAVLLDLPSVPLSQEPGTASEAENDGIDTGETVTVSHADSQAIHDGSRATQSHTADAHGAAFESASRAPVTPSPSTTQLDEVHPNAIVDTGFDVTAAQNKRGHLPSELQGSLF